MDWLWENIEEALTILLYNPILQLTEEQKKRLTLHCKGEDQMCKWLKRVFLLTITIITTTVFLSGCSSKQNDNSIIATACWDMVEDYSKEVQEDGTYRIIFTGPDVSLLLTEYIETTDCTSISAEQIVAIVKEQPKRTKQYSLVCEAISETAICKAYGDQIAFDIMKAAFENMGEIVEGE